jgi:phosphate transport system substrate-binding protein
MRTETTVHSRLVACVAALLLGGVCAAEADSKTRMRETLDTVVIPEFDFRAANIYDVITFFEDCSRENDTRNVPKEEKGVNIVLTIPRCSPGRGIPLITFSARNISVGEALRITTEVAGLKYDLQDNWIHVHPPVARGPALPPLRTSTPADAAVAEWLKGIRVPEVDFRQVTFTDTKRFIEGKVAEHAGRTGKEKGLRIHVDHPHCPADELPLITFAGLRISVSDAIRIMACVAIMECRIVDGDVRLSPRKIDRPFQPVVDAADAGGLRFDTFPDLVGSPLVRPLQMVAVCRLMGTQFAWIGDRPQPVAVLPPRTRPTDPGYKRDLAHSRRVANMVRTRDIHTAYMDLLYGLCDMVLAERKPNDVESRHAKAHGATFEIHPVVLDALVFTVNSENPVKSLSSDQLRAIYAGKIRNWKAVGGPDVDLRAFHRDPGDRSRELMTKLLIKDGPSADLPSIMTIGMSGAFNRLLDDKQGLGYSSFYHELRRSVRGWGERGIVAVSIDDAEPTPGNISKRTYPYATEIYLVTQPDLPKRSGAALLRDWLLSPGGQAVITESGYVPIAPQPTE